MNYQISTDSGARLRIDKWLWAARFFKTRSLASDAVEKGRVRIGGANVKPSKDVRVGDLVEIEIEHVLWQVNVGQRFIECFERFPHRGGRPGRPDPALSV